MESDDVKKMIKIGGVCGIVGIAIFLGVALVLEQLFWQNLGLSSTEQFLTTQGNSPYYQISIGAHLLVGIAMLLLAVAFFGLHRLLTYESSRITVTIGSAFGIIACAIMVIQATVQGTIMGRMGTTYLKAASDPERQSVVALYKGLRLFDQGIDLAFDTFFFFGWIVLAFAMTSDKHFGKILGSLGILLFGIAVIVNAWSAPLPPSFEMSPIVSLWVLAVYIQMLRAARSVPGVDEVRLNTRSVSS
jgi:uncharacterized membrane protein YidH (DUF202 family)